MIRVFTCAVVLVLGVALVGIQEAYASDAPEPLLLVLVHGETEAVRAGEVLAFAVSRLGRMRGGLAAVRSVEEAHAAVEEAGPVAVLVDLPQRLSEQLALGHSPAGPPLFFLDGDLSVEDATRGLFVVGAGVGDALRTVLNSHGPGLGARWGLVQTAGQRDVGVLQAVMDAAEAGHVRWVGYTEVGGGGAREWRDAVLSRPAARLTPPVDPWRSGPVARWGRGVEVEVPDVLVLDLWPGDAVALVRTIRERTDSVRPLFLPESRSAVEAMAVRDGAGVLLVSRCGEHDSPALEALLVAFTAVTGDEMQPSDAVLVDAVRAVHALVVDGSVRLPEAGASVTGPCGTSRWDGRGRLHRPAAVLERGGDGRWAPLGNDNDGAR